ncbi:MAG: hypothetical protein ACI8XB_000107 [Patiriisocius sp.]
MDLPDTRVSVYTSCTDLTCLASDDDGGEFDFEISLETTSGTPGCTDDACNFNPDADENDGSCVFADGCDQCDGNGGVTDNPEVGDDCDDGDETTTDDVYVDCGECQGSGDPDDCTDVDPSMWGMGPWFAVSQGTFVAESGNDAVLAKGNGDLTIEVFTCECGVSSIGVYNTVGAGANQIERIIVGDLIAGETYSYILSGGTNIMSKVKTYADSRLEDFDCSVEQALIDQIYALREETMYSNPAVQVTGFAFRFENVSTVQVIELVDATVDGFYQQLRTIPGIQEGHTYSVSVSHRVLQIANSEVANLWSDYGTECTVSVTDGDAVINDDDNSSSALAISSLNVTEDAIQAVVYPNSGDNVLVNLSNLNDSDAKMIIEVMEIFGKRVFSEQFGISGSVMTQELNFNAKLASGMYLVHITANGQSVTQKLSIK